MGLGELGERGGIGPGVLRGVESLEVGIERGPIVELVDAIVGAARHEHRLADPAPAMAYADPDRRIRADGGADDRVGEDGVAIELMGGHHLEVVAGAPSDEWHARARHAVRPADDLLLVAGQAVAQEQEDAVRPIGDAGETGRGRGARSTEVARSVGADRGRDREARATERKDDDARLAGAGRGDLTRRRAADQWRPAALEADRGKQGRSIEALGAEDHDERRRPAGQRGRRRFASRDRRIERGRLPDTDPARGIRFVPGWPVARGRNRCRGRDRHECLVVAEWGVREPPPFGGKRPPSVLREPRGEPGLMDTGS